MIQLKSFEVQKQSTDFGPLSESEFATTLSE